MPEFRYQALDADQQVVSGVLKAERASDAIAQLESAGLTVLSIRHAEAELHEEPESSISGGQERPFSPALAAAEEEVALRAHVTKILERAAPLAPALRTYAEEIPSRSRRNQLHKIVDVLQEADADKAAATLEGLPEYSLPLLSAVSSSKDPGHVLREFLIESNRSEDIRRQRWQTWSYPALVFLVAVLVLTAVSLFVVPLFEEVFAEFGIELPVLTQFVLQAARWVAGGGPLIAIAVLVGIALLVRTRRRLSPSRRHWFSNRIVTPYRRTIALARLTRFIADLLEGGLDVPDALRVAGFATGWSQLRSAAWGLAKHRSPAPATQQNYAPLTATILYTLSADMPKRSRIRLLHEVSLSHAERARQTTWWARGLLEPMLICFIGLVVLIVVLALFMPALKLVTTLSG